MSHYINIRNILNIIIIFFNHNLFLIKTIYVLILFAIRRESPDGLDKNNNESQQWMNEMKKKQQKLCLTLNRLNFWFNVM